MEDLAGARMWAAVLADACSTLGAWAVRLFDELEFVGRPCHRGTWQHSSPAHVIAAAMHYGST
eukprot:3908574-Alexandrium_andersonii.AAC.1